jgi:sorting nexin-1/2
MDGFDDLLSSSRRVSNDNPFDDPFAKRSSSPDPWANPFAQAQTSSAYDSPSGFGTPSGYDTPVFQDKQDINVSQETASQPQDNSSDPLKAEALSEEEPVKGHVSVDVEDHTPTIPLDENQPLSPVGFRQIPPLALEEEEVAAPQVEKPREPAPVITSPPSTSSIAALVSPTSPAVTSPPSSPSREHTPPASTEPFIVSTPSAILPAASITPSQPTVISPLSQSDHPATQSFRNLSIGGESWNGWPSEQTQSFTTAPPSSGWKSNQPDVEEDDDDDRPLQAIVDKSRAEASKQSDVEDKVCLPFVRCCYLIHCSSLPLMNYQHVKNKGKPFSISRWMTLRRWAIPYAGIPCIQYIQG